MNESPEQRSPAADSPSDDCTLGPSADDELLRAVAAAPSPTRLVAELGAGTVVAETYEIVGTLGAGGMGVVYEAIDRALGRRVAIKVHAGRGGSDSARVWREARAMARLADPHVVTVHEVGVHDDRLFIAMELVHGSDVRRWLRRGARTTHEILAVYRQAGLGLAAAHAVGVVHRDFKPDNVLVGDDGRVRVADFGLAREVQETLRIRAEVDLGRDRLNLGTDTGAAAGTPAYWAPEICAGAPADARSDQYAFCVAAYEGLVGERPQWPVRGQMSELARQNLPRYVHGALRRGLSVSPADRFDDMPALLRALDPPRHVWRTGLAVATLGAGAAVAIAATRPGPCEQDELAGAGPWDAAHGANVAAAFERSGFPDAAQAATRVDAVLAAWSADAVAARRLACEATHVKHEQSEDRMQLRIDCLDRMHRRVDALVTSLERADARAVAQADDATAGLQELARCEDTEALAQAEPIAAADRAEHAALRDRIDVLAVDRDLGRTAGLTTAIATEVTAAEAAGYADNIAAATLLQGREAIDRLAWEPAAAALGHAIAAGWRARDTETTIEAMRLLAQTLATSPSRVDDALRWLDTADDLGETSVVSAARDASLAQTRAHALYSGGRTAESEQTIRAALAVIPVDSALEASARSTLGVTLVAEGRAADAIAEHRRAIELTERLLGPRHPDVATRLGHLGVALDEAGQYEEGAAAVARTLALREAAFGPNSRAVATALAQVGENLRFRNDSAGELASYERALAITSTLDPPDEALRIRLVGNMIPPLAYAGEMPRARELLIEAVSAAQRLFGPESMRVAELLQMLTTVEQKLDNDAQAVTHGLEAARLFERHFGNSHARTAEAYVALASAMIYASRFEEATGVLARAAAVYEKIPDPPARMLGFVAGLRAVALDGAGRRPEALQAGATAVAMFDRAYPEGHFDVAEILASQAERLAAAQQSDAARELLVRALTMVADPALDQSMRAKIDRQLAALPKR